MSDRPQHSLESVEHYPAGWAPGPFPTPPREGRNRWMIALAALAVVVVLGAVLLLTREGSRADSPTAPRTSGGSLTQPAQKPGAPGTIASANDTGPTVIITDDVTCGVWDNIQTSVSVARNGGWNELDPWLPASTWDPATRSQFEAVADALRSGTDSAVSLGAQTPHRAMRELYEAFIAYGRAYADGMPNYQPKNHFLVQTSLAALDSITHICTANRSKVASVQEPGLAPVPAPTTPPTVGDLADPQRFLAQPSPSCARWTEDGTALQERLQEWSALDPNIGVGQLNKEQVLVYADAAQEFTAEADTTEATGRGSGNPVIEDFATLSALYFRAYASAVPLIWAGDHDLAQVGLNINELISQACQAAA